MLLSSPTTKLKSDQWWVVIPGYNEAKYLDRVLTKTKRYTDNIVFVDDGSSDNSSQIASRYTPHVLKHITNLGKGAALKTGCEYVFQRLGGEYVIFLDSDDQHDPAELELFIDKFNQGHQVVFGVRLLSPQMPILRRIGNTGSSMLIKLLFGRYIPDIPSGYKGLSAAAYQQIKWMATNYAVEMEIAARVARYRVDYDIVTIKTIYHDLDRGMSLLDILQMILQIIGWRISL